MQEQRFTEKDWKLFRSKIADWQESFMDRINREYIAILSEDANPSDKFWKLDKRIKEDRKKAGVQLRRAGRILFTILFHCSMKVQLVLKIYKISVMD